MSCGGGQWAIGCTPSGDNRRSCECSVDGEVVATCASLGGADCDFEGSCCLEVFGF
jgi:hypothetical protein